MAREIISIVEELSEGGYEAKAVGHSVFTEAETFGEPKRRIQDAGRCHFEPPAMPPLIRLHPVRDEAIAA